MVDGLYTGSVRDNRLRESSLGNLVANAWLWAANEPGRPVADIGIMNPGGLRSDLWYAQSGSEGDGVVTYAEAAAINPFANTLQTIDVTGAVFREALEQQWREANVAFLKLGLSDNVRYTCDPDRPLGDRILDIWVDGELIDPSATYTLTGDEAPTNGEIAALVSKIADKEITVVQVSDAELTAGLEKAGLPAPVAALLASFDANTRSGRIAATTGDLRTLTGRAPARLEDFLRASKAAYAG